jgi:hypothetical protein
MQIELNVNEMNIEEENCENIRTKWKSPNKKITKQEIIMKKRFK